MKAIQFKNVRVNQRFKRNEEAKGWERKIPETKDGYNAIGDGVHVYLNPNRLVLVND